MLRGRASTRIVLRQTRGSLGSPPKPIMIGAWFFRCEKRCSCIVSSHQCIYSQAATIYPSGVKTLIDIDEAQLAAAAEALQTHTKKDTVNAALTEVVALAARRRDLERLRNGALPDLLDTGVMGAAWRR
jgi:Arc/MetJ family transcription regulator